MADPIASGGAHPDAPLLVREAERHDRRRRIAVAIERFFVCNTVIVPVFLGLVAFQMWNSGSKSAAIPVLGKSAGFSFLGLLGLSFVFAFRKALVKRAWRKHIERMSGLDVRGIGLRDGDTLGDYRISLKEGRIVAVRSGAAVPISSAR